MKKRILQLAVIGSILLSGCAKKDNVHVENNITNSHIKVDIINPNECTSENFGNKIYIKQEEQIGIYFYVQLCKNSYGSIDFKGILTKEDIDKENEIIYKKEVNHNNIYYYDCNTEVAKKEKFKNVSICKKSNGFSEFQIISIDSI